MNPALPTRTRADDPAGDSGEEAILAAVGERLRAERDRAICGAHRHGLPIAAIARMMNMTGPQVAHIVADG
jgi:hypothetical protein